jgi:hypothetical protein
MMRHNLSDWVQTIAYMTKGVVHIMLGTVVPSLAEVRTFSYVITDE